VQPKRADWVLPAAGRSAARPPRLAVSSRSCWVTLPKESMEVVLLLTTELVTNAVRHATGPLGLRLARSDEGLLVEVDDRASRLPVVQDLDLDAVSGRGLLLVDKLSDGWGYSPARRVRPCGSGSTRDRDLATRVAQALTPRFTPARRAGRSDRLPPAPGDRAEPGPAAGLVQESAAIRPAGERAASPILPRGHAAISSRRRRWRDVAGRPRDPGAGAFWVSSAGRTGLP
jgi:anti-sigma regulatory factor (Ser/Thr protein kinase)